MPCMWGGSFMLCSWSREAVTRHAHMHSVLSMSLQEFFNSYWCATCNGVVCFWLADILVRLHFQAESRSRAFWRRCQALQPMVWPSTTCRSAAIFVVDRSKTHLSFSPLKKYHPYAGYVQTLHWRSWYGPNTTQPPYLYDPSRINCFSSVQYNVTLCVVNGLLLHWIQWVNASPGANELGLLTLF